MRFSTKALAFCLVSIQARFALAGPCKPLTTTVQQPSATLSDTSTGSFSHLPTTTPISEVSTTTTEATTTTVAPEGTSITAVFADGAEKDAIFYLNGLWSTPQNGQGPNEPHARFAIEPETSRLYTLRPDGSILYTYTVIPDGPNFAFQFDTEEQINSVSNWHFVKCTVDNDNFLSCVSESGPTPIFWYEAGDYPRYYGSINPSFNGYPRVRFRMQ